MELDNKNHTVIVMYCMLLQDPPKRLIKFDLASLARCKARTTKEKDAYTGAVTNANCLSQMRNSILSQLTNCLCFVDDIASYESCPLSGLCERVQEVGV